MPSIPDSSSLTRDSSEATERPADGVGDPFALRVVLAEMKRALVGRRPSVSVLVGAAGLLLAAVVAATVASTVGYPQVERWAVETWTGRNPHWQVFAGVGALVGATAVSAAANSGVVSSTLLAAGPLFGLGLTRYGTTVSGAVVSLPEAVASGAFLAVFAGIPVGVAGFAVGHLARWAARVVASEA